MSTNSQPLPRKRGPHFKINRAKAVEIKAAYSNGSSTVESIARAAGVTKQTIYNVLKRLRSEELGTGDVRWK